MNSADTLANTERPPHDRPPRADPVVPDLEAPDRPQWLGSATSEVEFWRARALAAEAQAERLARALARHRGGAL